MNDGPKNLRTDQQQLASGKPINRRHLLQGAADRRGSLRCDVIPGECGELIEFGRLPCHTILLSKLSKKVVLCGPDQILRRTVSAAIRIPSNDARGSACQFSANQSRRASQFVRHRLHRRMQRIAVGIAASAGKGDLAGVAAQLLAALGENRDQIALALIERHEHGCPVTADLDRRRLQRIGTSSVPILDARPQDFASIRAAKASLATAKLKSRTKREQSRFLDEPLTQSLLSAPRNRSASGRKCCPRCP